MSGFRHATAATPQVRPAHKYRYSVLTAEDLDDELAAALTHRLTTCKAPGCADCRQASAALSTWTERDSGRRTAAQMRPLMVGHDSMATLSEHELAAEMAAGLAHRLMALDDTHDAAACRHCTRARAALDERIERQRTAEVQNKAAAAAMGKALTPDEDAQLDEQVRDDVSALFVEERGAAGDSLPDGVPGDVLWLFSGRGGQSCMYVRDADNPNGWAYWAEMNVRRPPIDLPVHLVPGAPSPLAWRALVRLVPADAGDCEVCGAAVVAIAGCGTCGVVS